MPGRIKDFIAIPRPNLYQSLHTSVVGPEGRHFEIQIRTEEMHRIAEEGIAAHWKYKEGKKGVQDDQRVAWLRQLVEWQQDMRNPGDFDSTLRLDLYAEEVYCFTPKGRVVALPAGSTPVDFAYAVHSEVGNSCTGAKINGRIVQLKYTLRNGDVVDILTTAGHQPSKDWLGIVKTSRARNRIKHVINAERARAGYRNRPEIPGEGSAAHWATQLAGESEPKNSIASPENTDSARPKTFTRRLATGSFPPGRFCRKPLPNWFPWKERQSRLLRNSRPLLSAARAATTTPSRFTVSTT